MWAHVGAVRNGIMKLFDAIHACFIRLLNVQFKCFVVHMLGFSAVSNVQYVVSAHGYVAQQTILFASESPTRMEYFSQQIKYVDGICICCDNQTLSISTSSCYLLSVNFGTRVWHPPTTQMPNV